jgi:hypothetical protein
MGEENTQIENNTGANFVGWLWEKGKGIEEIKQLRLWLVQKNMKDYTKAGCVMTQCLIVIISDLGFEFLMNENFSWMVHYSSESILWTFPFLQQNWLLILNRVNMIGDQIKTNGVKLEP